MVGVVLALHFQDSVDPTALATLVLALATVGLAIFAWRALEASQREIKELHDQGSRAHRPVMIPVFDHGRMDLGPRGTMERMPKLTDGRTLVVPTENIGAGPALYLCAEVELSQHARGPGDAPTKAAPAELMGVAKTSSALLEFEVDGWPADPAFRLVVDYEDLANRKWNTRGRWNPGLKRWTDVHVTEIPSPRRHHRHMTAEHRSPLDALGARPLESRSCSHYDNQNI